MPRILERHLEPQSAVGVGLFGQDGQCGAHQLLPERRGNQNHRGDLVAARPEPGAAFLPDPVQVDAVRPLRGFGKLLGGPDPGQPVRAVRTGGRGQQVALVANGDQADRVHRAPPRNVYTTDVDLLFPHYGVLASRLGAAGVAPTSTLLQVARLAIPSLLVELEGTAVA